MQWEKRVTELLWSSFDLGEALWDEERVREPPPTTSPWGSLPLYLDSGTILERCKSIRSLS